MFNIVASLCTFTPLFFFSKANLHLQITSFIPLHLFLHHLASGIRVVVNGFQYFYHDPFSLLYFLYIVREEGITSIIRKSIETQWSFTQSLPIFLLRLNASFLRLPCQTTSKEIDQVEIVVFSTDDLFCACQIINFP